MRKIVFVAVLVVFGNKLGVAQIGNVVNGSNEVLKTTRYTGIEGSPYLFDEWRNGSVESKEGKVVGNLSIKYDSYKDCIEIMKDGVPTTLSNEMYPKFTILTNEGELLFKNGFSEVSDLTDKNYFEVLFEGSVTLLRKYQTKFVEQNVATYGSEGNTKKFENKKRYFFKKADAPAQEIKLNKGGLHKIIGDGENKKKVDAYIKENNLKVSNENSFILALEYYARLIQ